MTLVLLGSTLALSAVLTWYLSSSRAVSIMDEPNERSLHRVSTPRTGGLAILVSLVFGTSLCVLADRAHIATGFVALAAADLMTRDFQAILAATLLLAAVSLWDDVKDVSPAVRLGAQVVAAAGLVFGANFTIATFYIPWFGPVFLGDTAYPITILFIVWMANLYNFMDGLDGFAGGMAVIGFGVMGYLAAINGGAGIAIVALVLAAGAAGFLVFNYPPARIFMGDVGSVPIGFLLAALAVVANRERVLGLWVPLILFSPFIADATVVLFRRAVRGNRVWEAHREHYYQRLVLAGWSHRKTLWAEYLLMLACGAVAILYKQGVESGRVLVVAFVGLTYILLASGVTIVERRVAHRRKATADVVVFYQKRG